jgi:hypothetical protein
MTQETTAHDTAAHDTAGAMKLKIAFFWALALAPLSWGVWQTLMKVSAMFH